MGCPVDCSNGLSADYSDGLSGRLSGGLHCLAGQSLEWSLDSLQKIVPVSTMKFYNFPDYCPVRTMWGTVKTSIMLVMLVMLMILAMMRTMAPTIVLIMTILKNGNGRRQLPPNRKHKSPPPKRPNRNERYYLSTNHFLS